MENKKLIDKAIGFIQKNPKDNLSLQSIADNAGFSLSGIKVLQCLQNGGKGVLKHLVAFDGNIGKAAVGILSPFVRS